MKINARKIKSFKLFGKTWSVKFVDPEDWSMNGTNERYMGRKDHSTQEILIKTRLSNEQTLDTILHEIIHVMDTELDMKFREGQITQLATFMVDLLLSNEWRE